MEKERLLFERVVSRAQNNRESLNICKMEGNLLLFQKKKQVLDSFTQ